MDSKMYNNVEYGNLIQGIKKKNQELTQKNDSLKELAENFALFKREYAKEYSKKIIMLKSEGEKITLIPDLAKGDPVVAEARLQKDISKGVYDSCKSAILNLRLQIDSYRSLLSCEKEERFSKHV